jgi:hypothetical protein
VHEPAIDLGARLSEHFGSTGIHRGRPLRLRLGLVDRRVRRCVHDNVGRGVVDSVTDRVGDGEIYLFAVGGHHRPERTQRMTELVAYLAAGAQ